MKKITLIVALLAAAGVSAYIIYKAYPSVNPLGGISLEYNSVAITEKGNHFINKLNLSAENKTEITTLQSNQDLINTVYNSYSFSTANELLREYIPGYYWELEWRKPDEKVVISSSEKQKGPNFAGDIKINFDAAGNLLKFSREIKDSVNNNPVSENEARQLAMDFIKKYSPVNPENSETMIYYKTKGPLSEQAVQKTQKQMQTEYKFLWKGKSAYINNDELMNVTVSGNIVSEYDLSFDLPENASKDQNSIFSLATAVPFYIVVYVLIIIIGYKRIRAYEISFRLALIMGLIVGFTFSVNLYTIIANSSKGWELWLPLVFLTVLLTAGVFITWAVTETIAREVWKQKFISLDLLTKGYTFHSKVGNAGIMGIAGGFVIYLVWIAILFTSEHIMHISFIMKNDSSLISHFHSISPALNVIDKSIFPQIYAVSIFFLFVMSGLKRRFTSSYILISVSAVLWGVVNYNDLMPVYWGAITGIFIGALLMLFFNYYDVLATLIALIVFNIIDVGTSLFTCGDGYYLAAGLYLILLLILVAGFFIIGIFTKDKITDFESITPAFMKHITERQRMQRELEIARDVQMSFLPDKDPQFKGLDIAARCLPAQEVGGDYYDFVQLNENRFGIIIGDVSGKGTHAAFYMTLAKGFVKALSKTVKSPSEFLIQINELFYENMERGTFISMIYGIFDVQLKTLTFSRAGHNPVIARQSGRKEVELLNPVGLALGLEKGTIFSRTIKEIKVDMQPGDTFVFYTDGFTEARNKYNLEYSEERLTETISRNIDLPADQLLDRTIESVKTFIGKTLQHDDMTMVIVKFL